MQCYLIYEDLEHEFGVRRDGYYVFADEEIARDKLSKIDNQGATGQFWSQRNIGWQPVGPKTQKLIEDACISGKRYAYADNYKD